MQAKRTVFMVLLSASARGRQVGSSFREPSGTRSITRGAYSGNVGTSHRKSAVDAAAPRSWATMNPGASAGRIPAKVSLAARARVTAGLANEVDEVNQYAAVMYAPTANGTTAGRRRTQPQMTERRPKVAMNSLTSCEDPDRACCDAKKSAGCWNMTWATATPAKAPAIWAP